MRWFRRCWFEGQNALSKARIGRVASDLEILKHLLEDSVKSLGQIPDQMKD